MKHHRESRAAELERTRRQWDAHAERYDRWYSTFEGAVEHHMDWTLLQPHLPEIRGARVLDAAGGTGRATAALARLGYSVTICDLSPGMLAVARRKLEQAGVADRVQLLECDIDQLPFADEAFDLVLCWDGMSSRAAAELVRVTRRGGGRLSLFLDSRCRAAIGRFAEQPELALALLGQGGDGPPRDVDGYASQPLALDPDEARLWFEERGVAVDVVYGTCGLLQLLSLPEAVLEAREWDEARFTQVTELLLGLAREPSVKGFARHLVLYGERRP